MFLVLLCNPDVQSHVAAGTGSSKRQVAGLAGPTLGALGKTKVNIPGVSNAYDGAMAALGAKVPPALAKLANTPVGPMLRAGAAAVANKLGPLGRALVVAGQKGLGKLREFFCVGKSGSKFGPKSVGAAQTPFEELVELRVIDAMSLQMPASDVLEITKLGSPHKVANLDPALGPKQVRYQARFFDHLNEEFLDISINYDPETGLFGTIKPASGK